VAAWITRAGCRVRARHLVDRLAAPEVHEVQPRQSVVLERHARHELLATGARPRRSELRGAGSLTPAELRVAGLAAQDMSNREIAEALFVSLRTVETHLTHAYQKLEIGSRGMLAAALAPPTVR
jgi:DNA-binding CsgD family transcriptional regulator